VRILSKRASDFIYKKLLENIDVEKLVSLKDDEKIVKIKKIINKIVEDEEVVIGPKDTEEIIRNIYLDSFGFGPITELINNEEISEILINDFDEIYIEKNGRLKETGLKFRDSSHIKNIIDKILSPLGLRIDESRPMVDARLSDGSRINVVIRPISTSDMVVSIRKFKKRFKDIYKLVDSGALSGKMAEFLKECVLAKLNIIISGGTSTGKTTFLNVLSNLIPHYERIITIEETLELCLNVRHCVKLEARPPNIEGKGEITIRDLVRNSLRMRPDRIIVGEIRGIEAVDVLSAMNTGHAGSMTTVHANSPRDMLSRVETMLLMAGINLTPFSAQRIIDSSIDIIIYLERLNSGKRIISAISHLERSKENKSGKPSTKIEDIFHFDRVGTFNFNGKVPGFTKRFNNKNFAYN
jgi:pilus assembly protein CpaF